MSVLIRPFIIKCMLIKVPTSCVVDSVHGNAHLMKIANSSLIHIAKFLENLKKYVLEMLINLFYENIEHLLSNLFLMF